jgi:hypothetical protein
MAINSLQDLRATAPKNLQGLPDAELISAYAENTGQDAQMLSSVLAPKPAGISSLQQLRDTAPENLRSVPDEQLIVEYANNTGQDAQEVAQLFGLATGKEKSLPMAGLAAGVDQIQGIGYSALAGAADLVNAEDTAAYLRDQAEAQQYEGYLAGRPEYERVEDIDSVTGGLGFAAYQIAKQAPLIAATMVGGSALAPALAGTRVAAAASRVPSMLGGGGLSAGATTAQRIAALDAGGRLAGAAAVGTGIGFGSLYDASGADGDPDPWKALAGAPLYGVLESLVPAAVSKSLRLGSEFAGGTATRMLKSGGLGTVTEAGTELAQTEMEIAYDGTMTAEQKASQRLNAAVTGGVTGGAISSLGGLKAPSNNVLGEKDLAGDTGDYTDPETGVTYNAEGARKIEMSDESQAMMDQLPLAESVAEVTPPPQPNLAEMNDAQQQYVAGLNQATSGNKSGNAATRRRNKKKLDKLVTQIEQTDPADTDAVAAIEAEIADVSLRVEEAEAAVEAKQKLKAFNRAIGSLEVTGTGEIKVLTPLDATGLAALEEADPAGYEALSSQLLLQADEAVSGNEKDLAAIATEAAPVEAVVTEAAPVEAVVTETAPVEAETAETAPVQDDLFDDILDELELSQIQAVAKKLKAEISSEQGQAAGRASLDGGVLAGLVRMLRSPDKTPTAVVYKEGTAAVDAETTKQNIEQMRRVYNGVMDLAKAYQAFNNTQANLDKTSSKRDDAGISKIRRQLLELQKELPSEARDKKERILRTKAVKLEGGDTRPTETIDRYKNQASKQAVAVRAAMDNLIEAAGNNPKNVEAVIAALKTRNEKNRSAVIQKDVYEDMSELLNKTGSPISNQLEFETIIDTNLSGAFAQYKDGTLGRLDVVRGRQTRGSRKDESSGVTGALEKAAAKNGIIGILDMVGSFRGNTSGYAKSLTTQIKRVLRSMEADEQAVKVEFVEDNNADGPNYDPATNTISISKNASQEEILHEALHAATQWWVYQNPESQQVKDLSRSLDEIIAFVDNGGISTLEGLSEPYRNNAANVVELLRELRESDNELDAVLELVAYGSTMQEFKELEKAIASQPSEGAARWKEQLGIVWKRIVELFKTFLGVTDTVANNVLDTTLNILDNATFDERDTNIGGNQLDMKDRDDMGETDSSGAPIADLYDTVEKRKGVFGIVSTRFFFGQNWDKKADAIEAAAGKFGELINEKFPNLARISSYIHAMQMVPIKNRHNLRDYKGDLNAPIAMADRIAKYIDGQPVEKVLKLMEILDRDSKDTTPVDMEGLSNMAGIQAEANKLRERIADMVKYSSEEIRDQFENRKFSEFLLYVNDINDVATKSLQLGQLGKTIKNGRRTMALVDFEENKDIMFKKDMNGDAIVRDDRFYEVTVTSTVDGKTYMLMVSKTLHGELDGQLAITDGVYTVDTSNEYDIMPFGGNKNEVSFRQNKNYRELIEANKAEKIATALKNTVASIASEHATENLLDNLAIDGAATGQVFDTEADAEAFYFDGVPTIARTKDNPLGQQIVVDYAKAQGKPAVLAALRMRGTFVRYPDNVERFGEMSGKIVHGPMHMAIHDATDRTPLFNDSAIGNKYQSALRAFKLSKTVLSVGTHTVNAVSNVSFMIQQDIPIGTMQQATALMYNHAFNSEKLTPQERKAMVEFFASGAMAGNYSNVEVKKEVISEIIDSIAPVRGDSPVERATAVIRMETGRAKLLKEWVKRKGKKGIGTAIDIYTAEDNVFRLAAFLHHIAENKATAGVAEPTQDMYKNAGRHALDAVLNYDIDASAIKALRQTVMPFISWSYAFVGQMARMIVRQPWNTVNLFAVLGLVSAAFRSEEDDELRFNGPSQLDNRLMNLSFMPHDSIRLPFTSNDKPVYFKYGDFIPLNSIAKTNPTDNDFMGWDWLPTALQPSNPLISIITAINGYDPYTGNDLTKPMDTNSTRIWEVAKVAYDQIAPPSVTSSAFEKYIAAADGDLDFAWGEADAAMLVMTKVLGLRLTTYSQDSEALSRGFDVSGAKREYQMAVSRLERETARAGDQVAAEAEFEKEIIRLANLYQEKLLDVYKVNPDGSRKDQFNEDGTPRFDPTKDVAKTIFPEKFNGNP